MKKTLSVLLAAAMLLSLCAILGGCGSNTRSAALATPIPDDQNIFKDQKNLTLNVYNWGEYISDGSEGSLDTIKDFEEWFEKVYGQKVKVNYDTFASNEDMYNKLSSGVGGYDVIIPSDYMIAKMIQEDMLLPLTFDNIPNYANIDENFRGLNYDPDNKYTVPYTYGVVGIIYNANVVDEADAKDWDLLWNEKYAGQILQFNNPRDAFGTAQYKLGLDVNSTDKAEWDLAYEELKKQEPLVQKYVMDEVYNMMEIGEAAIAVYYAGDYFTMLDAQADDVDLRFYYPERTNYFVDAMCIPKGCQNKDLAEVFINYMLSEIPAVANAEYIYYASPNSVVYNSEEYKEDMGEEVMKVLYMDAENFKTNYNQYGFLNQDKEMLDYVSDLWHKVRN
jgi:spermidine/putrescine transport system substrate-binding protein